MSGQYEQMILDAFAVLGSRQQLAGKNFRLVASSGQTCAVYFSGNASGNAVEIGLSPKALAPLIGRTERELTEWLDRHDAARRERTRSGQRGSYPVGLAFGSRRELAIFLDAWREFARPRPSTAILERTRIEKAAEDAGFDLTPTQDGTWLVSGSSAFTQRLGVQALGGDTYRVGFTEPEWGAKAAGDCGLALERGAAPWAAVAVVTGYEILHALLQRAGRVAHLLAGEVVREFAGATAALPSTTEAERLTVQRVGQDVFRRALIDYWQGRCAVTGLDRTLAFL